VVERFVETVGESKAEVPRLFSPEVVPDDSGDGDDDSQAHKDGEQDSQGRPVNAVASQLHSAKRCLCGGHVQARVGRCNHYTHTHTHTHRIHQ